MKLSNFKKYSGPVIARRAEAYLAQGRVQLIEDESDKEAERYIYLVRGTEDYNVEINLDGDNIVDTFCNCPYNGMCKHITAALMDIRERVEASGDARSGNDTHSCNVVSHEAFPSEESLFFTLCCIAFSGLQSYPAAFSSHSAKLGLTHKSFDENRKILLKRQWFKNPCHIGAVDPNRVISVLVDLVQNRRDWLEFFESSLRQPDYLRYLTDVAKIMAGMAVPAVHYFRPSYTYYGDASDYVKIALISSVDKMTPQQISEAVDDSSLCELVELYLNSVLEKGSVQFLATAGRLLSALKHSTATSASLYCRYRLAVFYAKAELLPERPSSANYHYTYYLNASKTLLEGDTATAIQLYQEGLKIQNKKTVAKNIPDDNVSFFFYVIALSIRRTPKDVATLTSILKKSNDRRFYDRSWVFPLVEFSASADQTKDNYFIDRAKRSFAEGEGSASNTIAALTACFFGLKEKWTWRFPNPSLGILRKECEYYFGQQMMPSSEEINPWPYEAVMPRIPVREVWSLQIEELIRQVGSSEHPGEASKSDEKRLYYVVWGRNFRCTEVREQGRLASGGWSKGKKVSLLRYKTGDCPMDEIDKRIYEQWLKGDPAFERYYAQRELPSLELVLPYIVGTDKLALESSGPLIATAGVREEKPFLWTEKRDGEIHFNTNVPKDARECSTMYIHTPSERQFVIYPMPQEMKLAYKRILGIGHLPVAAEPMLEKLFAALRGRLEVHSDIPGGISPKKVDGSAIVVVRITPNGEYFHLSAIVRPSESGSAEFFPGEGTSFIYDNFDGERAEIFRNLRNEESNLRKVNALLPEGCEFVPERPSCILGAEDLLEFMERTSELPSVAALEWPEGEALKLIKPQTAKWEINAVGKGGWYELEGDIAVTEDKILSVHQLLMLLRESEGRYVRIGDKEFLRLSESIRRQLERIGYVSQESRGKFRVPELTMALVGDELSGEITIDEPEALLELRERIRRSREARYDIPQGLNATLRYYQEEGFQWLMRVSSWGAGACLADDMGLGKTVQAIAFMLAHAGQGPSMVIAPASVVSNWQREMSRFAPSLRAKLLSGFSAEVRADTLNSLAGGDVLLISYGLLVSEGERLGSVKWNVVCLDEAHTIKNRDTKTSGAAMKLEAMHRLILTGTPVQNHLGELWNLFRFIVPGLLGTYEQFSQKYMSGEPGCAGELKRIVAPFLLRRTKQEVVRELPDKEEIVVPVALTEEESAVYELIRREAVAEVEGSSSLSVNALSMITKLRMAACAASLAEKKWIGSACSKIDVFLDKLEPIVEGGNSVLVFSQFTSFLSMAAAALDKCGLGDYLYLDGQTPVGKRQTMVDSFQRGEHKIFLISLKAGGLGLNLTGANYVIHLDPWWNPAIEQQATDRAYRIGQLQKVTVYHLISSNTIEEKILRLHATKRNLADTILEGSDANNRITPDEILEMIAPVG